MARGTFRRWISNTLHKVADAIRRPETYAPPPLPTVPPEPPPPVPPPRPRPDREIERRPQPGRFIPRGELPREWGRNQAALWSDATKSHNFIGYDQDAQAFYDAALYDFRETPEDRSAILRSLKDYIMDTYGVDWDDVFDWEDYKATYDAVAGRGAFAHGGDYRN